MSSPFALPPGFVALRSRAQGSQVDAGAAEWFGPLRFRRASH